MKKRRRDRWVRGIACARPVPSLLVQYQQPKTANSSPLLRLLTTVFGRAVLADDRELRRYFDAGPWLRHQREPQHVLERFSEIELQLRLRLVRHVLEIRLVFLRQDDRGDAGPQR